MEKASLVSVKKAYGYLMKARKELLKAKREELRIPMETKSPEEIADIEDIEAILSHIYESLEDNYYLINRIEKDEW